MRRHAMRLGDAGAGCVCRKKDGSQAETTWGGKLQNQELRNDKLRKRVCRRAELFLAGISLAVGSMLALTGCHGSKGLDAFVIPEEFDTAEEYEITFWAKTTPIRPRLPSTNRPLRILKICIRTSR